MSMENEIEIDEKIIRRLERNIIIKENNNLKTREKSDTQMINWIKKQIEEEVQCYLNR